MFLLCYRLIPVSPRRKKERQGFHDCLSRGMLGPSYPNVGKHIFLSFWLRGLWTDSHESLMYWGGAVKQSGWHWVTAIFASWEISGCRYFISNNSKSRALPVPAVGLPSRKSTAMFKGVPIHQDSVSLEFIPWPSSLSPSLINTLTALTKQTLYPPVGGCQLCPTRYAEPLPIPAMVRPLISKSVDYCL